MKLVAVAAKSWFDKGDGVYTFARLGAGNPVIKLNIDKDLIDKLYFAFSGKCVTFPPEGSAVKVTFLLDNLEHYLTRGVLGGKEMCSLSVKNGGSSAKISNNKQKIAAYIDKHIGDIDEYIKTHYITDELLDEFASSLSMRFFGEVSKILDLSGEAVKSTEHAKQRVESAMTRIKELVNRSAPVITKKEIQEMSEKTFSLQSRLLESQSELCALREENAANSGYEEILAEMSAANQRIKDLHLSKDKFDYKRERIAQLEKIKKYQDKQAELALINNVLESLETSIAKINKEILWQENEIADIDKQLSVKQQQLDLAIEQHGKITLVKAEIDRAADFKATNDEHTARLQGIVAKAEELTEERARIKEEIKQVEETINEAQSRVGNFRVPVDAINATVDVVRLEAKMAEIELQAERLNFELHEYQLSIDDKEHLRNDLNTQFSSVIAADITAMPIKAKNAILGVIDAKIAKLEMINASLGEKENNYRLNLANLKNLEQEVLRSGQMLQQSAIDCASEIGNGENNGAGVQLGEKENRLEEIKSFVSERVYDRMSLLERINILNGGINEIARFIEINNAEISSLTQEKNIITRKYNDLLLANPIESANRYLRALDDDNGTKFLMKIQHDVVKAETELSRDMLAVEAVKNNLIELSERWSELNDRKAKLKGEIETAEEMVSSANMQLSQQLSDVHAILKASYEKHTELENKVKSIDENIHQLRETILLTKQTITANEKELVAVEYKIKHFIKGDANELSLQAEKLITEAKADRETLLGNRNDLTKAWLNSKVSLENFYNLRNVRVKEKEAVEEEINAILSTLSDRKGKSLIFDSEELQDLQDEVDKYGQELAFFNQKIKTLSDMLNSRNYGGDENSLDKITALQEECDSLRSEIAETETKRKEMLESYLENSKTQVKLAQASYEVESVKGLQEVLRQAKLANVVLGDRVRNFVRQASRNLEILTCNELNLSYSDNLRLHRCGSGEPVESSQLSKTRIALLYIACLSAVPGADKTLGISIVFGSCSDLDCDEMFKACRKLKGLEFVSSAVLSGLKKKVAAAETDTANN